VVPVTGTTTLLDRRQWQGAARPQDVKDDGGWLAGWMAARL